MVNAFDGMVNQEGLDIRFWSRVNSVVKYRLRVSTKAMLRRLILLLMIVAMPLQGLANAAAVHCPITAHEGLANYSGHHGHPSETSNIASDDQEHAGHHSHHHDGGSSPHDQGTTCCAAAVAIASPPLFAFPDEVSPAIALSDPGVLPSVFLEGPQRPPRSFG